MSRPNVSDKGNTVRVVQKPFDSNALLDVIRLLIAQQHARARFN
jgi:hypothetical protein